MASYLSHMLGLIYTISHIFFHERNLQNEALYSVPICALISFRSTVRRAAVLDPIICSFCKHPAADYIRDHPVYLWHCR